MDKINLETYRNEGDGEKSYGLTRVESKNVSFIDVLDPTYPSVLSFCYGSEDRYDAVPYKVIIYINYNVQTSDGQWHVIRSAMIYGSSGKYDQAERYTEPIRDVKITITEIDDDNVQQVSSESRSRYDDGYGGATYAMGDYMTSASSMVQFQ